MTLFLIAKGLATPAYILPKLASTFNLTTPNFQNLPEGHAPDPLVRECYVC